MLPDRVWRSLYRDVADAVNLAVHGQPAAGVTVLNAGLRLAAESTDHDVAREELVHEYRQALDGYCAQFGVRLPQSEAGSAAGGEARDQRYSC